MFSLGFACYILLLSSINPPSPCAGEMYRFQRPWGGLSGALACWGALGGGASFTGPELQLVGLVGTWDPGNPCANYVKKCDEHFTNISNSDRLRQTKTADIHQTAPAATVGLWRTWDSTTNTVPGRPGEGVAREVAAAADGFGRVTWDILGLSVDDVWWLMLVTNDSYITSLIMG